MTDYRRIADDLGILRLSADGEPLRYARHPPMLDEGEPAFHPLFRWHGYRTGKRHIDDGGLLLFGIRKHV